MVVVYFRIIHLADLKNIAISCARLSYNILAAVLIDKFSKSILIRNCKLPIVPVR